MFSPLLQTAKLGCPKSVLDFYLYLERMEDKEHLSDPNHYNDHWKNSLCFKQNALWRTSMFHIIICTVICFWCILFAWNSHTKSHKFKDNLSNVKIKISVVFFKWDNIISHIWITRQLKLVYLNFWNKCGGGTHMEWVVTAAVEVK